MTAGFHALKRRLAPLAVLVAMSVPLPAAAWVPEQSVEVVVGVAPGGSMDFTARLVRDLLVEEGLMPAASIVNNKPGGGHAVALAYTLEQDGSPYYLQVVNTPLISNPILGRNPMTFDQFTPIAMLFEENMVFGVQADSDIKDAMDLFERLKADPAAVSFSVSSGLGTVNHAAVMQLGMEAGVDLTKLKTVAFDSSAEGVTATLGGHVDVVVTTARSLLPFRESGDLRLLAVAAPERLPGEMADVPTWKELGLNVEVAAWRGVVAPGNISPEEAAYWSDALRQVTQSEAWAKVLSEEYMVDIFRDGPATAEFLTAQSESYAAMVKRLGITH